jgi:DNA invertase Pin-like site-specific DNA recombinase
MGLAQLMRCAIYARVSTTDQDCSLQLTELRHYVKARGWELAGEYVDTGWSGAKASRPQLDRLMGHARSRKVDCILVWKLDRWGRSVSNLVSSLQELAGLGVRWIATTQNLDTDQHNPVGTLLMHMLAAVAEFERSMIQERVKAGVTEYARAYKAGQVGTTRHSKSGKDLPAGRPKRIFRRDEAEKLRKLGHSWRAIAKHLRVSASTIRDALSR